MASPDLFKNLAEPARSALHELLVDAAVPSAAVTALVDLVDVAGVVLVAVLLTSVVTVVVTRADARSSAEPGLDGWQLLCAVVAGPLLWWLLRHPSPVVFETFTRADHVAFAALAGCALARVPLELRRWTFVLLSVAFLLPYYGSQALAVVLVTNALAFLALRRSIFQRPGPIVALHVVLFGALYVVSLWLRPRNLLQAMQMYGLFSFVFFRQISAAAAVRAGERPALSSYLSYLTFYPSNAGLLGGPEIYGDFARRNLHAPPRLDARPVLTRVVRGTLLLWVGHRFPVSFENVLAATTTSGVWTVTLLLFVATALKAMGWWAMIEANALLLGFRLQPNFTGLLTRTNPSELWWAWRGTFTNWLVRYVYGPLGASRRHPALNVAAAFSVSWLWHIFGLPFLTANMTVVQAAPITLWAGLNVTAVTGHLLWQRHGRPILPPGTPDRLRRASKMVLTSLLAAFNVAPLHFQGNQITGFGRYLRLLLGLG
jgi:D-alanyl-lipoteichoic acid acyltransferase DltB (MBOAT superfamily)